MEEIQNATPIHNKATHEGKLTIGDTELPCAVLNDGTRIITYSAVFKAFGRTKRGRGKEIRVPNMPAFVDSFNLQPFIDENFKGVLQLIDYIDKNGNLSRGYNANIIPMLCKVYLDARAALKLTKQQLPLARISEVILFSLSKIGITALVDEATGYQYERERDALQIIFKAYISQELLKWQQRFPDVFYKEVFRLNGWDYTVMDIRKRPGVVGSWTNKLIYERLPKGVLEELKNKTPKTKTGNYAARFHQSLTEDIGHPALQSQIYKVVGIMNISDTWKQFVSNFNKMVARESGQVELNFDELAPKPETKKITGGGDFDKTLKSLLSVPPPPKKNSEG
jgi:hypothetical protein